MGSAFKSDRSTILKAPKPLSVSLLLNNCSLCPFQFVGGFCHEHYFDFPKKVIPIFSLLEEELSELLDFHSLKRSYLNSWPFLHILKSLFVVLFF